MSQSPTPPVKPQSDPDVPLYTSKPTLNIPALGEDGRPPPVKYMCAALRLRQCPAGVLMRDAQVHARIPEPVTTPQASGLFHTTSQGKLFCARSL